MERATSHQAAGQDHVQEQICCTESGYALTYGRRYAILAVKGGDRPMVRVVNDRGGAIGFPACALPRRERMCHGLRA